jgi:hypothetical protein
MVLWFKPYILIRLTRIDMKKILYLLTLCAGLITITSCNDFLDRSPEDRVSDDAVWTTATDLKLYVNNFYNSSLLPRRDGFDYSALWTAQDAINGSDVEIAYNYNSRMNGERSVPESGGGWASGDWSTLRNINYFFANCERVTVGDPSEINRYKGEALFFRAMFYFDKIRTFGDVPWYNTLIQMTDEEALYKGRDSRKTVVENLLKDLDTAVSYLPSKNGWDGRVNKETAMLLQARIALYEGTWEKYHAGTAFGVSGSDGKVFIEKAASVTDALIALTNVGLDNVGAANGYRDLFNKQSYATSKEVLFWREYSASLNLVNKWARYSYTGAGVGLTKRMIEYYLCTDGKPIDGNALYQGDATLLEVVANRDPRLIQTIRVADGKHILDGTVSPNTTFINPTFKQASGNSSVTGYEIHKGHDPAIYAYQDGVDGLIYFRLAEGLLINAEAKAELGTITQGDVDKTINKLRDRVGMAHLDLTAISTFPKQFPALSSIINEVRRERAVELVAEGFRVDDIFRWAAADLLIKDYQPLGAKRAQWEGVVDESNLGDVVKNLLINADGYIQPYKTSVPAGYKFDSKRDYLSPLPITERVLNTNLTQNPGWDR